MDDTAIVVTKKVISLESSLIVTKISHDLQLIKKAVPQLGSIVLRGGCVIDILYGNEPNDIDLFYTFLQDNIPSEKCHCAYIQEKIKGLPFHFFNMYPIDLENSFEKEPRMNPIERTISLYSYHTDYISMFCIDESGEVWSCEQGVHDYIHRIYEMRYEGCLPWAYFHGMEKKDDFNYYEFLTYIIIRGVGYMQKRNLRPGRKFTELLRNSDYIIQKAIDSRGIESFSQYAKKKILSEQILTSLQEEIGAKADKNKVFSNGLHILLK